VRGRPALTGLDAPPRPTGAQARILYIEDNPANVEVVSRYLRSRPNVALHSVMSGQAGLNLAQQEIPDLILLDLHLPDMQGGEVLKRLKAEPATAGVPVAVLSAEAAPAVIRTMRNSGVVAYLTKPLNLTPNSAGSWTASPPGRASDPASRPGRPPRGNTGPPGRLHPLPSRAFRPAPFDPGLLYQVFCTGSLYRAEFLTDPVTQG
jgi:CheY-like chemotaxis protein